MQLELDKEDLDKLQESIVSSAVGKVLTKAVEDYLGNQYEINKVVSQVLGREVGMIAGELLQTDETLKERIQEAVHKALSEEFLNELVSKIEIRGY